ncbi:hypothetical protein D3C87_2114100 [compost metagenome]
MDCARIMVLKFSTRYACVFSLTASIANIIPVTESMSKNRDDTIARAKCAYLHMDKVILIIELYLILQI